MIDVLVTERGGSVGLEVVNTGSILLSIAASTGVYQLTVNESRDAYQLALAGGYNGSVSEWLDLTTGNLNKSLLSGKGYLITASASGVPMGLAPDTSGHALLYDPSQVGGLRWGENGGAGVGSVTSFNGREDVVTAISGDYQDSLITNTSTVTGGTVKNALDSIDLRLGSTGALINQVSGDLNFYSTGRDAVLTNNLQSTGSNLYGLLINATGELGTRISNTGSSLFTLNSNTSGALNFYLTGGDSALSSRIESTGSSLDSRVNILGTRIENTGSTLFNFANTISGELNNADSALSTRIQNTGSNLYNLIVNESGAFGTRLENTGIALTSLNSSTSGAINFYLTGEDKRLSDRIDNSGSLLINGSGQLDYNITGLAFRLEQTGSATVNTVNSVFGRQGAIVQQSGDYSNTGITNQSNVVGGTTAQALNTLDQRLTASGALGGGGSVTSVFGRAGVVVGQSGDYADTGVTNTSSVDGGSVFHALNSIHSRINNSGGLLINLSGEFDNKLGSTGSILLGFANTVSGELNFYLTGGDSALSTRLGNTGSNLYNLLVNESGSFETRLKNTGDTLISLNSSTSGAINLALTGADATLSNRITNSGNLFINASGELSNRISSTGSTLDSFIRNVSGELNLYYTGADNVLSSRIENTGSSLNTRVNDLETRLGSTGSTLLNLANTISGELNFYSTGRDAVLTNNLQSTGSNLYGMLISATGELKTKIEATGSSLFNLNLSTSGALNFNITGSDAALSLRIEQTGAATQNTVNSVFGRQGSIIQQSGDYANTGITNLSTVIGATTADALNTLSSRLGNTGNLLIGLSGEFNNKIESTGSTLFNFTNTASGELNFYLTGGDSALSARLGNTGSILHGLISNSSGEFNTKIGNTGAALISLNSSTSGAINYYLTGGDAALLTTINNSGSVLHGLIINSSGEFNTKLSSTGTALSSLNSSTSGDINFYLTGGDAELSNRIASTGSTLDLFVRNTSGELNFYLTGGDASLSSRLGSTGSLLPNVTLNSSLTGVLEITGQTIYGKDAGADKIPFWDNSEKRLGYLNAGSGLYITGDVINAAVGSSSSDSIERAITQSAHGFVVGDLIYHNGTIYAKSRADVEATAEVLGMVAAVAGVDDFTLQMDGYITGLSGLTAGTVYYLSTATAGAMQSTAPATLGHVDKPVFMASSTTAGYIMLLRGMVVSAGGHDSVTLGASLTDVLSLSGQVLSAVDAGADKIKFWDDSAGKETYATIGEGLLMTATTLSSPIKVAIVSDVKAYNVSGGTFTSGADRTRDLNTESDPDSIVSVASNAFTPIAGTYLIEWTAPGYAVDRHFSQLYNKTAATRAALGTAVAASSADNATTPSTGAAIVTCNGTDEYEIRHRCATTSATYGFGISHDVSGADSVYTVVKLTKLS